MTVCVERDDEGRFFVVGADTRERLEGQPPGGFWKPWGAQMWAWRNVRDVEKPTDVKACR